MARPRKIAAPSKTSATSASVSDKKGHGATVTRKPNEMLKVAIIVTRSGKRGSQSTVWAHEVPMLRRKSQVHGESLTVQAEWPERTPRCHVIPAADLRAEYDRLVAKFVFKRPDAPEHEAPTDLVADWVGPFQGGNGLRKYLNHVADSWAAFEKNLAGKVPTEKQMNEFFAELDPESVASELIELDA